MVDSLSWEFADSGGGDEGGINDPLITTFKGKYASLARESIQNIIDARLNPDLPAKAEFNLLQIKANEIPGQNSLKKRMEACRDYFPNNPKCIKFFDRASKVLEKKEIPVLKISDYNTSGLSGSDHDKEGNYYNLMKAVGSSSKVEGSGGSFGIGKGAYWAASDLRTVFIYSVLGDKSPVFQGKSRLVAHEFNGITCQNNGSFGKKEQKPVRDLELVPSFFTHRTERGTDFFILGFEQEANWIESMTESILSNFWLAIVKGDLEVKIHDRQISKDSVDKWMRHSYKVTDEDSAERANPLPHYIEYVGHQAPTHQKEISKLGLVKFYVTANEKFSHIKNVVFFRKTGMVIVRKPYSRIRVPGFAGIFVCDNDDGNELLRTMENQNHDEWNDRLVEPDKQKEAKKVKRDLFDFVKECLQSLTIEAKSDIRFVPNLEKILCLPADDETSEPGVNEGDASPEKDSQKESGNEISVSEKQIAVVPKSQEAVRVMATEAIVGTDDDGPPILTGGKPTGGGKGRPAGGKPGEEKLKRKILTDIKMRTIAVRNQQKQIEHVIIAKGKAMCCFDLSLRAGTDNDFDEVKIDAALAAGKPVVVKDDMLTNIMTDDKGRAEIVVKFLSKDRYSLKPVAYENQ